MPNFYGEENPEEYVLRYESDIRLHRVIRNVLVNLKTKDLNLLHHFYCDKRYPQPIVLAFGEYAALACSVYSQKDLESALAKGENNKISGYRTAIMTSYRRVAERFYLKYLESK
jgi:hypothetical protein